MILLMFCQTSLTNIKSCKIDECEEIDEKVKKSIVIVKRDKRENIVNFNRKTIFVHDIDFLDVVNEKKMKKKNNSIVIKEVKEIKINEKKRKKRKKRKKLFRVFRTHMIMKLNVVNKCFKTTFAFELRDC